MTKEAEKLLKKGQRNYTDQEWQDHWNAKSLIQAEEIKADEKAYNRALIHVEVIKAELEEEKKAANRVK